MKVNIYVDWDNKQIMSDTEVLDYIAHCTDDYVKEDDYLEEWLCNNYTMIDLWHLSDEARLKAEDKLIEYCYEMAKEDFRRTWDVREIEI